MNQKPQPNTGLKVGDRVRLIAETLAVARFHFANLDFTNVHRILKFNL
jgi:hypothetical protein